MGKVNEAVAPIMDRLLGEFQRKHKRQPGAVEVDGLYDKALKILEAQGPPVGQFWLATMESSHYTWTGIGRSPEEAIVAIKHRWDRHIKAIPKADRGDALTWTQFFRTNKQSIWEYHGGCVRRISVGHGYMDHEDEADWRRLFL